MDPATMVSAAMDPATMYLATLDNAKIHNDKWKAQQFSKQQFT